jgi:glutathione peroxidase
MKKILMVLTTTAILASCKEVNKKSVQENASGTKVQAASPAMANDASNKMEKQNVYDFPLTSIDGKSFSLKDFTGKKILLVNTASKCGYTPQYEALEALYKKYQDKLVVVGFPANNFGGQEPGTNEEVKDFCKKNYGVTFPLSEKVSVKGDDAAPLFKWLLSKEQNGGIETAIKWNFTKFLIDEKGNLIANFPSSVKPMDEAIISKL